MTGSEERVKERSDFVLHGANIPDRANPANAVPRAVEVNRAGQLEVYINQAGLRKWHSVALTGTAAVLFTAPKAMPRVMVEVVNTDPSAVYYASLYVLQPNESVSDANAKCKGLAVAPGYHEDARIYGLGEGDVIQGLADTASKLTVYIWAP